MIFEASITKNPKDKKSSKITSRAFDVASSPEAATHVKLKNEDIFIELTDKLVIKRVRDEHGNKVDEEIHYSDIVFTEGSKEEYVYIKEDSQVAISPVLYSQIVLMNKSDNGNFVRCDDGTFVHKDELQIPAYKKVPTYGDVQLKGPTHDGKFYVEQEIVVLKQPGVREGVPVVLTKENRSKLTRSGDKWLFDGVECVKKQGVDTRKYVSHILLDEDTIVDVRKLSKNEDGQWVVKGIDGKDVVLARHDAKLKKPFVQVSNVQEESTTLSFKPRTVKNASTSNKRYSWRENEPGANGLLSVNHEGNYLYCNYIDGRRVYYFKYGYKLKPQQLSDIRRMSNVDIYRVRDIAFSGLSNGDIVYDFKEAKKVDKYDLNKQEDLEYRGGLDVEFYPAGDKQVTNIKWQQVEGNDVITSYSMNGVTFNNIVWDGNKIKSCKARYNKDGKTVEEEIADIANSRFKNLAIECTQIDSIENLKINKDNTISFKLGNYKITNAVVNDDGVVGKCKLQIGDGKIREVDISTDSRFKQLQLILQEHKMEPLAQSKLFEKKDGKYVKVADIIQTEEMQDVKLDEDGKITEETKNNGVAKAKTVETVSEAVEAQEKFKESPFKTVVFDSKDKDKVHTISDTTTKYEGVSEFTLDNDILPDVVKDKKIEVKKGKIVIDPKKDNDLRDGTIVRGFALIGLSPITAIFGLGFLMVGAAVGVVAPIARKREEKRLQNRSLKDYTDEMQNNVTKQYKQNINSLVAGYERALKEYKKMYPEAEFRAKAAELRSEFRYKYMQEVVKLQMLGQGAVKCEFDASKKTKLTNENYLAVLAYQQKRKELEFGKEGSPELQSKLKALKEMGMEPNAEKIERVRLLQELGGAESQKLAHKLKMDNIDLFLSRENAKRAERGEPALSKGDYKKVLNLQYAEGKLVWGGIEDKLEVFKQTPEYLRADKEKRKELLEAREKELQSELTKIKIEQVGFDVLLDKNGQPVVSKLTQSSMAHMEAVDQAFATGDFRNIPEFSENFYDKLSPEDQARYTTTTLSEASVKKVNTTTQRRMQMDKKHNADFRKNMTEKRQNVLDQGVKSIEEGCTKAVRFRAYEEAYKAYVLLDSKAEEFKKDCQGLEEIIARTPHSELDDKATKEALAKLEETRKAYAKQKIIADNAKKAIAKDYEQQVKKFALQEFAQTHRAQYEWHKKYIARISAKGAELDESSVQLLFFQEMSKDKEKAESYAAELDTYKVKHNVEQNVESEVFCAENADEYKAFIEERNKHSKTGQLDPSSEIARCYFYAHCQKSKPKMVSDFKKLRQDKCNQKARERIEDKTLTTHEEKIIRSKGKKRTSEKAKGATAAPATPVPAPELGRTA